MPKNLPPPFGAVLRFLRFARGWAEKELAQTAGLASPSLVSAYERGQKRLTRKRLEELLALMDVGAEAIDAALLALQFAGPGEAGDSPIGPTEEERRTIERAAARVGAVVTETARSELTRVVKERRTELARLKAGELWETLKGLSPGERRTVIEVAREYRTWALCERLCEESEKAGADRAERAVELSNLALRVAGLVPPESWRGRLLSFAWAFVGNARRVSGDLPGADEAFFRSSVLWQEGDDNAMPPLAGARRFDLEASLRQQQGRFEEAVNLLEAALDSGEDGESRGRLLIKKGMALLIVGRHEQSIEALWEAGRSLGADVTPRTQFAMKFNLTVNLSLLGRFGDAEKLLPGLRETALELGNELDLVRVLWLEGRVAAGLGRRYEGLVALEQVRAEFTARAIAFDAALVSLELAVLHLEAGQIEEVKALARQLLWIFRAQGIHRETLAALRLFCQAADQEALTLDAARHIRKFLEKARFEPYRRLEF